MVALAGVSAAFHQGEFTAIMGPSGSGKSTLLQCMAGLDRPDQGQVVIAGEDVTALPERRLTAFRRDRLGFVFQAFNLIPTLTARENITLGPRLGGPELDERWLAQLVHVLGLADRLHHRPAELSGGQQQRVAVARALVHRPDVVFADEPTGNLDSRTAGQVLEFVRRAVTEFGQTVIMVTHDPAAAAHADRVLFLRDGAFVDELVSPTSEKVLARLAVLEGLS
ncbi:ABC transporter ATP-binding protein [Streptoalloteichus tenebrarius]|uniref:ABC transporter ATP-binding protein n=1 Tax=Streptoalloteichus tenebrarius (strain ATCC 17920 / DSM 40477 / JCM 4838 / CBS 697.72 / NBRC 16177 / NCIMB 11028 / NRRL B-12390 / A12253. 1 / ISP 5477) TaxID=1933 RepID=UPI0027E2F9B2|nr:ABC transporter ATP-binding protein [Streptoalloteichus tenebrarius]